VTSKKLSLVLVFWAFLSQLMILFISVIKAPKSAVLAGVQVGAGAVARVCPGLYLKSFFNDIAMHFVTLLILFCIVCLTLF